MAHSGDVEFMLVVAYRQHTSLALSSRRVLINPPLINQVLHACTDRQADGPNHAADHRRSESYCILDFSVPGSRNAS